MLTACSVPPLPQIKATYHSHPNRLNRANDVVKMHVLPPTADIGATWTSPFMENGAQMFHAHGSFLRGFSKWP
jgi:hypothetical protein